MKKQKPLATEAFVVKFWFTNTQGFKAQGERTFNYHSKNRHDQARKDCIETLRKEGQVIEVISVVYQ